LRAESDEEAKGLEIFTERWVIAPVARQIENVTGEHFDPGVIRDFVAERSRQHGAELAAKAAAWTRGGVLAVAGSVYEFFLILMIAAFLVIDRKRIARFFANLPPPEMRAGWDRLVGYVDRGLAGVIRGQLVICVVNGLLTWVGLLILGVPYATLLAFVAGVLSLIPVFGTIASSIPIVLVALATGGIGTGLLALGWIFLIHILEANVFNPLIMGTSAELHPVLIVFALLAGEHAFGVWGALLAVPTASILISVFKYYRHEVLGVPTEEPHGHGKWFRDLMKRRGGPQTDTPAGGST
ncbi:MAG TPA: AI-2E family transporter, partial [Planctomycetota bacterium]|nr:AI-2E family transporter [Planctomycetota bacterium]